MKSPADPVERSTAPAGDLADVPETVKSIEVTDQNERVVGLLMKWAPATWLWADAGSYADLSEYE